jgi:predicted metalloprotease
MKIRRRGHVSQDVIDKRAETRAAGGMGGGLRIPGGAAGGIGGIGGIIVLILLALFGGGQLTGGGGNSLSGVPGAPEDETYTKEWIEVVLDDIQDTWVQQFERSGDTYERAKLILFEQGVQTGGCGFAPSEVGPFYCPADKSVYIDLSFFRELETRFGAPGDFAPAYVIAHEVGHHVQNITGVSTRVRQDQQRNPNEANELSVRLELQADCLAGVWASDTYENVELEEGDIEEGLGAAAAVGDDRLQKQAGAEVNPDTWTHGSSEQRQRWFITGYQSGDPASCDTFSGSI